ncbi:MAG: isoprenyl transferase [Candidatus Omnitrophica bacterium]|nr:isoprenyl transferase [Candidatus Omnitrophota bacterium]
MLFEGNIVHNTELQFTQIPQHIAIIMDGNGRWAKQRDLPRTQGHIAGVKRVEEIIDYAQSIGVKVMTLFTFSTENWSRPEQEVTMLMTIVKTVLQKKLKKLQDQNMRFQVVGRMDRLPEHLLKEFQYVIDETKNNDGLVMNLAFNYGARLEIIDAIKSITQSVVDKELAIENIDEEVVSSRLYTKNLPDPDLLIRTSGEKRISNFLLWQLSYAEFYFSEKLWPDFDIAEFQQALLDFQKRERRFGHVSAPEISK